MPQLDKLSFITQYFWLSLFFFVFYYFILNYFVILIFKNLKLRNIINNLFLFRMFHVDFDKGIINWTNKLFNLNFLLYSSIIFNTFAFILKKSKVLDFNNVNVVNLNFYDLLYKNISVFNKLKNINNIKNLYEF